MSTNAITSIEDLRAEIVGRLREYMNSANGAPASSVQNPSLDELRSQIVAKAREQMGITRPSAPSGDYVVDVEDMRTRMLFNRVKNANISRGQRDALSSFVRSAAEEGEVGKDFIKSVSEIIFFMEMTARINRRNEMKSFPLEKTVNNEMKSIYKARAKRESTRARLDSLREKISASD